MSIPYNEGKNDNLFVDRKDNSTDLFLENNNNNNLKAYSIKSFVENKNNINNIFFRVITIILIMNSVKN